MLPKAALALPVLCLAKGWLWLLYEVAAIIVFGLASMVFDRLRRLKRERAAATILPTNDNPQSSG